MRSYPGREVTVRMSRDEIIATVTKALYGQGVSIDPATGVPLPKLHYCTVEIGNYEINIDRVPKFKLDAEWEFVVGITSSNHVVATMPTPTSRMSEIIKFAADKLIEIESEVDKLLVDCDKEQAK